MGTQLYVKLIKCDTINISGELVSDNTPMYGYLIHDAEYKQSVNDIYPKFNMISRNLTEENIIEYLLETWSDQEWLVRSIEDNSGLFLNNTWIPVKSDIRSSENLINDELFSQLEDSSIANCVKVYKLSFKDPYNNEVFHTVSYDRKYDSISQIIADIGNPTFDMNKLDSEINYRTIYIYLLLTGMEYKKLKSINMLLPDHYIKTIDEKKIYIRYCIY